MELTQEQYNIINSSGNIKINAVAGSGKTTTIIEYAKKQNSKSRILYLAFNKSVKLEAIQRFNNIGLHNVQVETAHSLAYRHIVFQNGYKIRVQGYKSYEIAEILGLKSNIDNLDDYILSYHINKFAAYYCNSDKQKVRELNYLDVVSDEQAKHFVKSYYDFILNQTRQFLGKMNTGEIEITHDFYLKKFQLSKPKLHYDYILFDEGQDASGAMLDVFFNQNTTKIIVGDTHQQIYGWRYAVNSLEKADYDTLLLSSSFRFSQDIANLAMEILDMKSLVSDYKEIEIIGMGNSNNQIKSRAVIARTNLMLLLKAIELIFEKKIVKKFYFEGNINSYTYASEGSSIYDVLHLRNNKHSLIRDKLIKRMKDLDELTDYIKQTNDVELSVMLDIVKKYGNEIPHLLKTIKQMQVDDSEKDKADFIFSSVHKCKGMEYDEIHLTDDFINENTIKYQKIDSNDKLSVAKILEEINILYVAITRAKSRIYIPQSILPKDFPSSPNIIITVPEKNESDSDSDSDKGYLKFDKRKYSKKKINSEIEKSDYYEEIRKKYENAYTPWTTQLDNELTKLYCDGTKVYSIAKIFGRNTGSIISRIKKLDLANLHGSRNLY